MGLLSVCTDAACAETVCDECEDASTVGASNTGNINLPQMQVNVGERELAKSPFADALPIAILESAVVCGIAKYASQGSSVRELVVGTEPGGEPFDKGVVVVQEDDVSREEAEDRAYRLRLEAAVKMAQEEEKRQREEEAQRQKDEEVEELEHRRRAAAEEEALARRRLERGKVAAFLRSHGFSGVAEKRKKLFRSWYALHAAVGENDAEMVTLLLNSRADCNQKNHSGQTPEAFAQKLDNRGSHEQVIEALKLFQQDSRCRCA